ncbi:MAG: CDP-glucose 4,6-dehydratase [Candidatus Margulisiibacteriota bacterium]
MVEFKNFFQGKKIFLTGATGFKGSWLTLWLTQLGSKVTGFSLAPPTNPSLFDLCQLDCHIDSICGDVCDLDALKKAIQKSNPEIVIHMAAQSLVRESYENPLKTYTTNVIGTANLLEAVRECKSVRSFVNVTTDKCYENKEWVWGYRENEPLGGYDPYSSSKACSELVTASYRNSFFNAADYGSTHFLGLASARAGNVIGGGDWARDRLIPDFVRSILKNEKIIIRSPDAIRPWQHVLEPLSGYLILAKKLYEHGPKYAESWNFGPDNTGNKSVEWIINQLSKKYAKPITWEIDQKKHPHEANYLKLDCAKARARLSWQPVWDLDIALDKIIAWINAYQENKNMFDFCSNQIKEYEVRQKV